MEFFEEMGNFLGNGTIPVTKYKSKDTGLTVYFAGIDSQVINGYFCFGVDRPEGAGIETMLWHLDSSGGLLPRQMRGDIIRPTWQHHGAENPLADRDQSSYVCCALGETAFLGTFSCSIYLLQNIEAVFEIHGYQSEHMKKFCKSMLEEENSEQGNKSVKEGGEPGLEEEGEDDETSDKGSELDYEACECEPDLASREFYFLTEAGEGAMAWEGTLQAMFPGVRAFWNRLLCEGKTRVNQKMRECYDNFYRPENLTVIITGNLNDRRHILETLHDHEEEYKFTHPDCVPFVRPWSEPLPIRQEAVKTEIKYVPRNPNRNPLTTVCFGWRGCSSNDLETAMALKVFTAHISVGPLWSEFVSSGLAHRISWCQLEYVETCALITIHGISCREHVEAIEAGTKKVLARLGDANDDLLNINELRAMADRIGWHYVRELETDPFLILAAAIFKGELYGNGDPNQIEKRVHPRVVFDTLLEKPADYWKSLAKTYYQSHNTYMTIIIPKGDQLLCSETVTAQAEESCEQTFVDSSRRASSRPRRKANSVVQDLSRSVADLVEDFANNNLEEEPIENSEKDTQNLAEGHFEELIKINPFPFGDSNEEADEFEGRLKMTEAFLEQVVDSNFGYYSITSFQSDGIEQHPQFSVADMPFFTYLEDTETSFVYITYVIDTTCLDEAERKLVAPITAALGAVLCPRPPGLDTDIEIPNPTQFNPPQRISDSQISLGLNGEMMQSIFATLIVRPENYEWAVGMFHYLLYEIQFNTSFLIFIASEAAKGLACTYKMQTADVPNYDCFDSTEINLHCLVKHIYKQESNARLFVGRRRLDLTNEFKTELNSDPEQMTNRTNTIWRKLVDKSRISVQIATNLQQLIATCPNPVSAWKTTFANVQKPLTFSESQPTIEREMITQPCGKGFVVSVNHARPSCLSMAIPIDPSHEDFPKICLVAQLFSMAQKWVWNCLDEEDVAQPVLRMPCSYANILTLNLESCDVIGSLEAMKLIISTNWPWLNSLLIATKLMVVNDPATMEMGPQGAITSSLLAHLNNQSVDFRRELVKKSLCVTIDDVNYIIKNYLSNLLDPEKCWYALMSHGEEEEKLTARLRNLGFNLKKTDLTELCTSL